jgi:hypothetical protein
MNKPIAPTAAGEARQFAQALLNANVVARQRGDRFGLCDCVDNAGNPYPSQWLADLLAFAREQYGLEAENLKPLAGCWSTRNQWPEKK